MQGDGPPLPALTAEQAAQAEALWRALEGVWASGRFEANVTHHRDGGLSVRGVNTARIDIPAISRHTVGTT